MWTDRYQPNISYRSILCTRIVLCISIVIYVTHFFLHFQYVCHQKTNNKYSPDKLWYIASFVRGMTVDEALKQLSFINKKGAKFVKEAILEAQERAVSQHHVEFKSNLWIGMYIMVQYGSTGHFP